MRILIFSEHQVHDLLFALILGSFNWSQIFECHLWLNAVKVHKTWCWRQGKNNWLKELIVHNDNMLEIDVSKFNLDIRQDLADRSEFGRDICSSNFEFNLIVRIFKFYFVLIYELTK